VRAETNPLNPAASSTTVRGETRVIAANLSAGYFNDGLDPPPNRDALIRMAT
jgi:hypothetical protein